MTADFVEPRPVHKYPTKSGRDVLDAQYKGGLSVIEKADWARVAFDGLRRRFTHVPEETLVRLFHDRTASQLELIQGAATFAEYNAMHPLGRKRVKVKAKSSLRTYSSGPVVTSKPAPKAAAKPAPKAKVAKKPAKAAPKAKAKASKAKRRR
jgi:hypothetical protein